MQGECLGGVAALFGEETEFGEEEGGAGAEVDFAVPGEGVAEVLLGEGEVTRAPGSEGEADLGVDLARRVAVLGGQGHRLPVKLRGLPEVTGQESDPAEPGDPVGGVRPEAQFLGQLQTHLVQSRGARSRR